MSLMVKGGADGICIFELRESDMMRLVLLLVEGSMSFYCEPWSDSLVHVTLNGSNLSRVRELIKDQGFKFKQIFPRKP